MTEREFADFELQLEFALAERTDSGVAVRCDPTQTTGTSQAEIQIVDQADASFIATYDRLPFARTGALSGLAASTTLPAVEHNTWHTVTISCIGRRLKATVDNVMTVDTNLDDHGGKEQAAGRAGIKRTAGPIGLQRLQGKIRYRNIRIRALGGAASNSPVPADAVVFGGHAYRFFDERLSWKDAQARCRALGGNLAVVESLEENTFVGALVAKGGRLDVWLGITDEAREGTWVTVSGQPVTYTNWWNGQPNNKQNEEHYAVLSNQRVGGVPMDWKWSDQPNVPHQIHQPGFVCEWDTIPTNGSGAVRGGGFGGGGGVKGGGGFGVGGGTRSPANDGWNDLFNGRNLTGWREFVTNGQWTVNNGAIATSGGTGSGWLATEKEYTDFELELEYKQPPGGNSGVFLRIPDTGIATGGQFLEVQLLQDSSKVLPYQRTGALYRVAAAPFVVDTPADTWHKLRVRAAGPVVTTWINDRQVVSGNVATAGATTADGGAPMPHVKRRSGRIGLQRHGTPGEFRNLRIKEL